MGRAEGGKARNHEGCEQRGGVCDCAGRPCALNHPEIAARARNERATKFWLAQRELDVLCESLWHSLARADVPDEDIDTMRQLRERLNDARK